MGAGDRAQEMGACPPKGGAAGPPSATKLQQVRLWIVRHGERIDEVPGQKDWGRRNPRQWFDPPLTENGKQQARSTAELLKEQLGPEPPIAAIFTSPLRRCLQTAEQLSEVLGLPIQVVPGIGFCSAALMEHGLASVPDAAIPGLNRLIFRPSKVTRDAAIAAGRTDSYLKGFFQVPEIPSSSCDMELLAQPEREVLCPQATWILPEERLEQSIEACVRLCREAATCEVEPDKVPIVLVVAHRELMYCWTKEDKVDWCGLKLPKPDYASVMKLLTPATPGGNWLVEEIPRARPPPR